MGRAASRVGDIPVRSAATTGRGRNRLRIDIRDVITALDPILRGWGNYFRAVASSLVDGGSRRQRRSCAKRDVPVCRLTVDHHDPEGPPGRAAPQLMDQLYAGHASPEDQHVTIGHDFSRHIPPERSRVSEEQRQGSEGVYRKE